MRQTVLFDATRYIVFICHDFNLLLLYGMVSPYCSSALGLSLVSQIYLLRLSLFRYFRIQFSDPTAVSIPQSDKYHIEYISERALTSIDFIIWPGLSLSFIVFVLYLFDIGYDTDDNELASPIVIVVFTLVGFLCVRKLYFVRRNREIHLPSRKRESARIESEQNCVELGSMNNVMAGGERESSKVSYHYDVTFSPLILLTKRPTSKDSKDLEVAEVLSGSRIS
jgi:F0F1-type ATP synthase assembly protein I